MTNEFAKVKPSLLDALLTSINQIHDGVLAFQEAAAELQDFGQRLRAMTDRIDAKKQTLDSSFGEMQFPKGILRTVDGDGEKAATS